MNRTNQQLPSNPALEFAQSILDVTNGALELIEILNEIAEDDEKASTNDRIAAANVLMDRGLGKCPRQTSHNPSSNPKAEDNDVGALREAPTLREAPSAISHNEPESPRLVTQIDDTLNQSLGPAPSAHIPTTKDVEPAPYSIRGAIRESPEHENADTSAPFDPDSIHFTIQQHILEITNNGQTLRDTLLDIARAEDAPRITPYHRRRAVSILLDRALGTDPNALRNGFCPDCRQRWTTHTCSPDPAQETPYRRPVRYVDPEALAEVRAEIQRMKDEGILTPIPNARKIDISKYRMPKDFDPTPYAKEEAAAFWADIELRLERQKKWPEIEERRRKKLAEIYPSHSDDEDEPPDP